MKFPNYFLCEVAPAQPARVQPGSLRAHGPGELRGADGTDVASAQCGIRVLGVRSRFGAQLAQLWLENPHLWSVQPLLLQCWNVVPAQFKFCFNTNPTIEISAASD